jgi:hypothetical protein
MVVRSALIAAAVAERDENVGGDDDENDEFE